MGRRGVIFTMQSAVELATLVQYLLSDETFRVAAGQADFPAKRHSLAFGESSCCGVDKDCEIPRMLRVC